MKKKANWSLYSEPSFFRSAPQKPLKEIKKEIVKDNQIKYFHINDFNEISLTEVINKFNTILLKNTDKNLILNIEYDQYHDYSDPGIFIFDRQIDVKITKNPKYKKELEQYEIDLLVYKKAKDDFAQELIDYKAWKKEELKLQDEKKIKAAKALLKKHNIKIED